MWPVGEAATGYTYWWAVPGMLISQRHQGTLEKEKNVKKTFYLAIFLSFISCVLRYANKTKISSTTNIVAQYQSMVLLVPGLTFLCYMLVWLI